MKNIKIKVCCVLLLFVFNTMNVFALQRKVKKMDDRLNRSYQNIMSELKNKNLKIKFRNVQRKWIKYRDNVCSFDSTLHKEYDGWVGKATSGKLDSSCLIRVTQSRLADFRAYVKIMRQITPANNNSGPPTYSGMVISNIESSRNSSASVNPDNSKSKSFVVDRTRQAHVIGVYQGDYPDGKTHGFNHHPDGRIDVIVKKNPKIKSVVLVLMSYEPVNWHIKRMKDVKIEKIILSGYHPSKVSGVTDVPVLRKNFGVSYKSMTSKVRMNIENITNAEIQPLQGGYNGKYFEIF